MHAILLEDSAKAIITPDLALVGRVLQVTLLDVCPDLFDGLRSGELVSLVPSLGNGWSKDLTLVSPSSSDRGGESIISFW